MREPLRHSLGMLRNLKLVGLHLVANAVLLVSASFGLLIPDAHVWQLLLAGVSALLILFVFLWIHSGTLAYAAEPAPEKFRDAFSIKIGRMVWLLVGLAVLFWCMRTVDGWRDSQWQISGYVYSKAPSWLHPTAGSSGYVHALGYLLSVVFWYLLPSVLLPLTAAKVAGTGFRVGLRALGSWRYWLGMAMTTVFGVWVTSLILGWTPGTTLGQQTASLIIRVALAYAIATAAWLATAGLLGYFVGPGNGADVVPFSTSWKRFSAPGGEAHSLFRHCLAVIRDKRVIALQLTGGVVVAVASGLDTLVQWEHTWQVVSAIIGGLLLLIAFLWLHSGTLAYAAQPAPENFRAAFHFRPRRMSWLLLGLVILVVLMVCAEILLRMLGGEGGGFWLTGRATDVVSWYLLPCLVLPWTMVKVGTGGSLRAGLRPLRRWLYWAAMAVVVFPAHWVSDSLLGPLLGTSSLRREVFVPIALAISSLPYVVGWVLVAGLLGYFVGSRNDASPANVLRQAVP